MVDGEDGLLALCPVSPSTVHRSPFTVHRSPFTVHRPPSTVHLGRESQTDNGCGASERCVSCEQRRSVNDFVTAISNT